MTQSGHTGSNLCARSFFACFITEFAAFCPSFYGWKQGLLSALKNLKILFEAVEIKIDLPGNSSRNRDAILSLRQCRAIIYHIMFFFVKERIGEPDF